MILLPLLLAPTLFGQSLEATVERGLVASEDLRKPSAPTQTITARMKTLGIPGVSVAVISNFSIEWAKGYGYRDMPSRSLVDTETMFEAGSISKPVAALGALTMVDRGLLDLDTDVNKSLKRWKVPDNEFTAREKVTLRRILTHTAGLTVHGFGGYRAGSQIPTLVQVLDGEPPANSPPIRVDVEPGTIWRYSGGGFTIMQMLIEDVSGATFDKFMNSEVLSKIRMSRSSYSQPLNASFDGNEATAYQDGTMVAGRYHTYPEMAAAGLWTTPSDLAKLGIELMHEVRGDPRSRGPGESGQILTPATAKLMSTPGLGNWGLGIAVRSTAHGPMLWHNGVDAGFEAWFCIVPETGNGAVVMTNAQGGMELCDEVIGAIARAYGW